MFDKKCLSHALTYPVDQESGALLLDIVRSTLTESWGTLLFLDDALNFICLPEDMPEAHWNRQTEFIGTFLRHSMCNGGFATSTEEYHDEALELTKAFLTEELEFQLMVATAARNELSVDLDDYEMSSIAELLQYSLTVQAAVVGRMKIVASEVPEPGMHVPSDSLTEGAVAA